MDIKKSDWKLYRDKIGGWQENYMGRLLKEYILLLQQENKNPSERFWELEERLKEDKRNPGVRIELKKSEMNYDLARLVSLDVISLDDLTEFSQELQNNVKMLAEKLFR